MTDLQNNNEMIAVGHEFARTLSSDTPIIEIAKMITRLAGRLDCATLALREMTKQRDAAYQAERVWERTMMDACGEDEPKSVADKFAELKAQCFRCPASPGICPMSSKHHELLGVPKHANQHRLSRLTMEVHTDELRMMASEVENFTDELIAALEAAETRLNKILTPNMLLPVIGDMDADNLRHVIKTVSENYALLHAKWEAAEKRISELEAREVKLPQRFDVQTYSCSEEPEGEWYARDDVLAALATAGVRASEEGEHG